MQISEKLFYNYRLSDLKPMQLKLTLEFFELSRNELFRVHRRSFQTFVTIFCYTLILLRKKGYINFVSKSVRRPSVCPSVTFLVNVSPPKPLEVAT